MRAGSSPSCAAQQTLSAEAASVLKLSLSHARRRGNAQVTPLHVAATLLTSRAGILRRACLRSQPSHHPSGHPLQCRALELCFNVALNRLPAAPVHLLSAAQPSLSNALVAALKRAQAHQRRGCIEQQQQQSHHQQQQQPLVATKVELEQLVLSILDDPSVSRVMREAGFSSAAIKTNLEDGTLSSVSSVFQYYGTSGGIYSTPNSPPPETHHSINPSSAFWQSHLLSCASSQNLFHFSPLEKPSSDLSSLSEDVKAVMEVLLRKTRNNAVVVGDSLSMAEHVVSEIMDRIETGDVPEELKSAHFIKFPFYSAPVNLMKREEIEMNIAELRRKIDSFRLSGDGGVIIIYTGDLKWTVDNDSDDHKSSVDGIYRPVDHLIAEIGKLLSCYNGSNLSTKRIGVMATANYQTYTKCQMKQPPLDVQWCLHPVSVPSGGLGLSLNATSGHDSDKKPPSQQKSFSDSPHTCWLKPHPTGSPVKDDLVQLRRKYNDQSRDYIYQSSYSNWPNKNTTIFTDSEPAAVSLAGYPYWAKSNTAPSTLPRFRRQQSCQIHFRLDDRSSKRRSAEPNLDSFKGPVDREAKITLALGSSASEQYPRIDELDLDSNVGLIKSIQENVPWQSKHIPSVLQALSARPSSKSDGGNKFLLIKGNDVVGKRRLAAGLARFVFGSSEFLFRTDLRKGTCDHIWLDRALRDREKIVVLVENVDRAGGEFADFLDEAHERGRARAVFVLTTDDEEENGSEEKDANSIVRMKLVVRDESHIENARDNKRKAALDLNVVAYDQDEARSAKSDPISRLLENIKNRFVFNRDSDEAASMRATLLSKLRDSFEKVGGYRNCRFGVEGEVLGEILKGSGLDGRGVFERWSEEVFEAGLGRIGRGEGERVGVRLCLDEGIEEGRCGEDGGFMGTCLPQSIPLCFTDKKM